MMNTEPAHTFLRAFANRNSLKCRSVLLDSLEDMESFQSALLHYVRGGIYHTDPLHISAVQGISLDHLASLLSALQGITSSLEVKLLHLIASRCEQEHNEKAHHDTLRQQTRSEALARGARAVGTNSTTSKLSDLL